MYKYSAFGRIVKYIGMFHLWNIMEQFVPFFIKNQTNFSIRIGLSDPWEADFSDTRILFVYTDKSPELCPVEI